MQLNDYSANHIFDLSGRKALITGGSRGIAAAIASALAQNGAHVCINYSSTADEAMGFPGAAVALREALSAKGCHVSLLDIDLSCVDAAERLHAGAIDQLGHVDILVLSASLQIHRSFFEMSLDDADRQIRLNLLSAVAILKKVLPCMVDRGYGRILALGSVQENAPSSEMPVYSATKAAQLNLVQNLAVQHAADGVLINNLSPGLIETDRNAFKRLNPASWAENVSNSSPMQRAGLPSELVGAALLLCSDAASFMTGASLQVTGGGHIARLPSNKGSASHIVGK